MEYVNVANIIEQERKKRQAQIFKGVDTSIIDHIEKAHEADFQKGYVKELPENLQRFSSDIESFNKAETEFLLSKIQGELNANFNNPLLKSMKTIALNHLNTEIEKARSGVYADTAENRKLNRVGQHYGSEKRKKLKSAASVTVGASAVKYNGKTYMVTMDGSVETITGQKVGKALSDKIRSEKFKTEKTNDSNFSGGKKQDNQSAGGKTRTLDQITSDLAASGKYASDSALRRAAKKIFDAQGKSQTTKATKDSATKVKKVEKDNKIKGGKLTANDAAKFLSEHAEDYFSYQYGDMDDDDLYDKFEAASKFIKKFENFDWAEEDEANEYKTKMEKKGYNVIDVGDGINTIIYALIKKDD